MFKDIVSSFLSGAAAIAGAALALYLVYSLWTTKFVIINLPKFF